MKSLKAGLLEGPVLSLTFGRGFELTRGDFPGEVAVTKLMARSSPGSN